jgi:hypothetical protein
MDHPTRRLDEPPPPTCADCGGILIEARLLTTAKIRLAPPKGLYPENTGIRVKVCSGCGLVKLYAIDLWKLLEE